MCSVFCLSVIITIRGLGTDKNYFVWPFKGESQGGRRGQYLKDCLDCGTVGLAFGREEEVKRKSVLGNLCKVFVVYCVILFLIRTF